MPISPDLASTAINTAGGIASGLGGALVNEMFAGKQMKRQKQLMDYSSKINEELSKNLYDYQNQFNQWANNRSQMADAGFNSALMYGDSMSKPALSGSSASAPSAPSNMPFKSIDPNEGISLSFAKRRLDIEQQNADSQAKRVAIQNAKDAADTLLSAQQHKMRQHLEQNIYDTAQAELDYTRALTDSAHMDKFVKGADIGLKTNTSAYYSALASKIAVDVENLPQKYQADIKESLALVGYYAEKAETERQTRGVTLRETEARIDNLVENLRSGEVNRIAHMFGLHARHKNWTKIQSDMRELDIVGNDARANGFIKCLLQTGHYTRDEAIAVYMYYTAENPKDVTPAGINAVGKVLSK